MTDRAPGRDNPSEGDENDEEQSSEVGKEAGHGQEARKEADPAEQVGPESDSVQLKLPEGP